MAYYIESDVINVKIALLTHWIIDMHMYEGIGFDVIK